MLRTPELKLSKHPTKPDSFLLCPSVTLSFNGELPPKDITVVIDTSGSMQGVRIDLVKKAMTGFINALHDKDHYSVITFNDTASCLIERRAAGQDKKLVSTIINNLRADGSTNIADGISMSIPEIRKAEGNKRNTAVILLSDGDANKGELNPAKIAGCLNKEFGEVIRIIPMGIGTGYRQSFMKKLGLAAGFRGLIHLEDNDAEPETAFTQVMPYLQPRSESEVRISVNVLDQSFTDSLGYIECNIPSSTVFEYTLPAGKDIKDVFFNCTAKMGNEATTLTYNQNTAIDYDADILTRYYTMRLVKILEKEESSRSEKISQFTELLRELDKINQSKLDIYSIIQKTVADLEQNNISATMSTYATSNTVSSRPSSYYSSRPTSIPSAPAASPKSYGVSLFAAGNSASRAHSNNSGKSNDADKKSHRHSKSGIS